MKPLHPSPPFGGWSRGRRDPSALIHGMVGRAVAAFHRIPHGRAPATSAAGAYPPRPRQVPSSDGGPVIRRPDRSRSLLSLLRSRRHGRERILRYIILPALAALAALGIYFLLRN